MEIQYIREFLALVKFGNYLVASDELFISQSTLSKHIFSLEKELGISLFNRTTRKVQLSQYGTAFLPYAQQIVEADTGFRNKLSSMSANIKDGIMLGVLPAFLSYHIDDVVLEFRKRFPQFSINLMEGDNSTLLTNLDHGICNLALVRSFEKGFPRPDFEAIPMFKDRVSLILLPGSLFDDGRSSIQWKDLDQVELLTSTSSLQAAALADYSQKYSFHLNIISRLSRTPSIIEMLKKEIGVAALLQRNVSETYQKAGPFKIVDIDPPLYSTIFLVYRKDMPLTKAMQTFINMLTAYLKERNLSYE